MKDPFHEVQNQLTVSKEILFCCVIDGQLYLGPESTLNNKTKSALQQSVLLTFKRQ